MALDTPETTEPASLRDEAYRSLRTMIVSLDFAPGDVLREGELKQVLGIGRTPIREALQRLEREHFVTVIPRRGMFVAGIDVSELSMLFETRTVMEPYAARLAAVRGDDSHWSSMQAALEPTSDADLGRVGQLGVDRVCHEIMWQAARNRFLVDTLDMLYAQSERLWHLYLVDAADMDQAVAQHLEILTALRDGNADRAGDLVEAHVRTFDEQVRLAVTARLDSPLAGR